MKVRVKSMNTVGDFVSTFLVPVQQPQFVDGKVMQAQGLVPYMLVALRDCPQPDGTVAPGFAYGPIQDMEPVFDKFAKADKIVMVKNGQRSY